MRQLLLTWTRPAVSRPMTAVGVLFLLTIVIFAAASPWIAPYPPDLIDPVNRLQPPGPGHLLGTDHFGRDTFSRIVYGARLALLIGVGVVLFALATGVPIGVLSALFPALGVVLMRMVDVLMSFPSLLLALGLIVILGQGVFNAILAIGLIYLTTTARIVYGVALRLKAEPYVEAARSAGAGTWWIVTRHILPNMISPLLVQASFVFAFAQLGAASLDFLGLGAPPEIPSWGNMLAESRIYITRASWLLLWPGLMIVLTAFSLNLVGDALRDRMDPRFREMMRR
ncbi:ABC transporter permease subunit [Rhodobacteraceae bacterium 2CG4]|uniref:ABC transporter permease subunit n=1 Tax=Halovulum marinum TaxID=2662447 RepID=A0A6L5YZD0_9RHOB|nr:ABC transporter permease [Halovulum marinum]MSU89222.1 ABC transporter permease subunit [Halovulum marinum]